MAIKNEINLSSARILWCENKKNTYHKRLATMKHGSVLTFQQIPEKTFPHTQHNIFWVPCTQYIVMVSNLKYKSVWNAQRVRFFPLQKSLKSKKVPPMRPQHISRFTYACRDSLTKMHIRDSIYLDFPHRDHITVTFLPCLTCVFSMCVLCVCDL